MGHCEELSDEAISSRHELTVELLDPILIILKLLLTKQKTLLLGVSTGYDLRV